METHKRLTKPTLFIFTLMNFVLAMSSFLFNGILDQVAQQLTIPISETGLLNSAYAYGAGLGVPITLVLFRKFERTSMLKIMLALTILASIWMIFTTSFEQLLLIRFLTGVTGNGYGVLAMGTVAALTPPEKLGSTLAKLIMGASLALVIGMPLTRMLSQYFNWQVDYLFLIVLMIIAFIYFLNFLPSVKSNQNDINFKSELALLKNKETLFVLFSSLITFIGYGSLFTYVTPYLLELFPNVDHILSYYLIIMGLSCFSGNLFGGYMSDRIGFKKALLMGTASQILLTALIFAFQKQMWVTLILILLWQFMGWFVGLQLNTGINITTQNKSSFILSLNSSNIQLGQAFGLSIAVFIIKSFGIQSLSLLTLSSAVLILLISTVLKERA
ncbi:hypothetical protein A9Q68_06635 [Streptococcus bovimastitidis]|uniref:Major facilitator superfamily (MFS) profile domain-containing protein n=1 Tax=Streptococcus bovimastitidis TaxID=1856638 RepID=A0A1L8MLP3_9STRE|nr:MFS transporter [Streptococcus bovimastitidis]OJF71658.1 hypothetical protein A9Q68_06635 [Streptococcus bovimastitidis]